MVNLPAYQHLVKRFSDSGTTLVAVSKLKSVSDILVLYNAGQRDFGENYVQELVDKAAVLPQDIRWHFIGHLQRNKVKYIAPFVHLIHGIDSEKLLIEVNKQALKVNRTISCLLQIHIAAEETKFGLDETELTTLFQTLQDSSFQTAFSNIRLEGFMGMASFTEDTSKVRDEFKRLAALYTDYRVIETPRAQLRYLSMGMSNDYEMAIECGSNMVRIGSLLFGAR